MSDLHKKTRHKLNPGIIFLIDGIGAILSTILLIFLLAPNVSIFGITKKIIYYLSLPTIVLMCYSLSCYFLKVKNCKLHLKFIAAANLLYCFITLGIIFKEYKTISSIGISYFLAEIIIILFVIRFEIKTIAILSEFKILPNTDAANKF